MIKVKDGSLYQWDTGRKVQITPKVNTTVEIDFANDAVNALKVESYYDEDEQLVADIPDVLLQSSRNLKAYVVVTTAYGKKTISGAIFTIHARPKPKDYIYTETETKSYDTLLARIENLEQNGGNAAPTDVSWNDLEDKPFYEEIGEVEVFPPTELTLPDELGNISFADPTETGIEYFLYIGDTVIKGTSQFINMPYYSNGVVFEDGSDSCWESFRPSETLSSMSGTYTVKVVANEKKVKTIDEKYLPKDILESPETYVGNIPWDDIYCLWAYVENGFETGKYYVGNLRRIVAQGTNFYYDVKTTNVIEEDSQVNEVMFEDLNIFSKFAINIQSEGTSDASDITQLYLNSEFVGCNTNLFDMSEHKTTIGERIADKLWKITVYVSDEEPNVNIVYMPHGGEINEIRLKSNNSSTFYGQVNLAYF